MYSYLFKIKITILFFLFSASGLNSSETAQDISAIRGMQLFDSGKYEEAETVFRQLLTEDPDNVMLNYYYGACRTENGNFSEDDLNYLLKAGEQVTPHRMNYYLGLQYHARNQWEQAMKYYNQFRISVPEEEQKELNLAQKIEQCYNKENPFITLTDNNLNADAAGEPPEIEREKNNIETDDFKDKSPKSETPEELNPDEKPEDPAHKYEVADLVVNTKTTRSYDPGNFNLQRSELPDLPGVESTINLPAEKPVEFLINNDITYLYPSHFQTEEGKNLFEEIQLLEKELDNTITESEELRIKYRKSSGQEEKTALGKKILELENRYFNIKEEINSLASQCRIIENNYWQSVGVTEKNNFIIHLEKVRTALNKKSQGEKNDVRADSNSEPPVIITSENLFSAAEITQPGSRASQSPELIYKIQIGAYRRLPSYIDRLYKKLSLIRKIENYKDENGVVVYTTGNLTNYEDAVRMKEQVKQ
jgi:tetratricopeptide (TPR) repeat protein